MRNTLLVSLFMVAACAAPPPPAARPLEQRLLAALGEEDAGLRGEAAYYLGLFGDARDVDAIGALADDADSEVRSRAIMALGVLAVQDPQARVSATRYLLHALHDGVALRRRDAATALGGCAGGTEDWSELIGCLADGSGEVRVAAASTLARLQVPISHPDVAGLFREFAGSSADGFLCALLPLLRDPEQRELLAPMLHSSPSIRDQAQQADARLDAITAGAPASWTTPAAQKREQYRQAQAASAQAVQRLRWQPVSRQELLDAARRSRFVMFGEIHRGAGPLREAQCELLRAFAGPRPDLEAVGFEPSVERAQRLVIDAGRQLGMTVLPLEQAWQTLHPMGRHAERDDETAAAINSWLADPSHRLFVVRGQSHVMPGGYWLRQLREQPLVVLSTYGAGLSFDHLSDQLSTIGRTWRLGDGGNLWYCGTDDFLEGPSAVKLQKWLHAR